MDAARVPNPIFDDLSTLSDSTRSRMLLLLERHELTVSELCDVLQLPQSTVSRHLKTLADANWVISRREATSRYYTLALDGRESSTRRLWSLLREQVSATAGADQDAWRLKGVLGRRRTKSEEFFDSAAGQWDKLREDLFGAASHLQALPALLDERWVVGDLGCGTGHVAAALAPYVARVIAVDRSGEMLQAAKRRLREWANVDRQARRARVAPDRRWRARCRHAAPGPASSARPRRRARRSRTRSEARGAARDRRYAPPRSRGVPAADGPCVAGVQRRPGAWVARSRRFRTNPHRPARCQCRGQRAGAVRGKWAES